MSRDKIIVNMKAEFESTPIRHVSIQCPYCQKWFYGHDVTPSGTWLSYDYQLRTTTFTCPICDKNFGCSYDSSPFGPKVEFNIEEVGSSEECYKDCVSKKVTWE